MQPNQMAINKIQSQICDRIVELFDLLEIEYEESGNYLHFPCPIHNGDNNRACFWSFSTSSWKCMTRSCEQSKITGPSTSIFGLVRGILSNRFNKNISFKQTVQYLCNLLHINIDNNDNKEYDPEIADLIKKQKKRIKRYCAIAIGQPLFEILPRLKKDTIYYPKRKVSDDIINKYHISICLEKNRPFTNRAFFPVLDDTGKFVVGFSGRSIFDKCPKCKMFHDNKMRCPDKKHKSMFCKWRHSKNFQKEKYLYNYNFAKPHIFKNKTALIVEGFGDVWKLEKAGIKNSVAVMGLSISEIQRKLLQRANALTLIFMLDNDQAGQEAINKMKKQLQYYFRLRFITPETAKDIGEIFPEEITEKISPMINNIVRRYNA